MIVATPNRISVNPTCRSRTIAESTDRVRPKMLYSPVWASDSEATGVRDCESGRPGDDLRISTSESGDADISVARTRWLYHYWNRAPEVSSQASSVRHRDPQTVRSWL